MSRTTKATGLVAILAVGLMGCNPITTLWFLNQGDRKAPPEYPLKAKGEKKEVTVAVIVSAPPTLGTDFAGSDRELATLIGKRLVDDTKDDKHPIVLIDRSKIDKVKTTGTDWRTRNMALIGKQLGADYIMDVTLNSISMFQPEYAGEYYQGRAGLQVMVYDTANPEGVHQEYVHNAQLPEKGTASVTPAFYRRLLLERVASEIAWKHIPHTSDLTSAPVK